MHGFSNVIYAPTTATSLGVSTESTRTGDQLVFVDLDFGELEPERGSLFMEVIAGDSTFFNVVPFIFTGDKGQCRCVVLGKNLKKSEVPKPEDVQKPEEHIPSDADDENIPPSVWLVLAAASFIVYLMSL